MKKRRCDNNKSIRQLKKALPLLREKFPHAEIRLVFKEGKRHGSHCFNQPNWWHQEIGNKMRIKHILHALEHHNGFFKAIEISVVDKNSAPRSIDKQKGIYPKKDQWWVIDKFDSTTGEFRAIQDWNQPEIFLTTEYDANLHNNKL